jgi:hypothetical protein
MIILSVFGLSHGHACTLYIIGKFYMNLSNTRKSSNECFNSNEVSKQFAIVTDSFIVNSRLYCRLLGGSTMGGKAN